MFRAAAAAAFEAVDDVDNDLQRWNQCDQQEDQREGPWLAGEVWLSDWVCHSVEDSDCHYLEEVCEKWSPCTVALVGVRGSVGELGAKLEDDEADDESDHEHRDVRDRELRSSYVVADSWEPQNHGLKYDEYDDSCDEAYEGRHDGRKRAPSPFVGC